MNFWSQKQSAAAATEDAANAMDGRCQVTAMKVVQMNVKIQEVQAIAAAMIRSCLFVSQ